MSMDLVHDYVVYLGSKDRSFRGIKPEALKTTDKGTMQIYDYIRKRIGPQDEKRTPIPVVNSKSKPTPPKTKVESAKDNQIKDDPPVGITADEIPGHHEEKDAKFYQHEPSSDGVEPNSTVTLSEQDDESYSLTHTILGANKHQRIKRTFIGLMDAQPKIEMS